MAQAYNRAYLPYYTPGGVPKYVDGPVFTTTIPLPKGIDRESVGKASGKTWKNVGKDIEGNRKERHNHNS